MKFLFILDPLNELNVSYDSSLAMIRTMARRGHACYFALIQDLYAERGQFYCQSRKIVPVADSLYFKLGPLIQMTAENFGAILVRKEPPFDMAYIYMTYLLEIAARKTPVLNDPRSLRDTNEKFSTVELPKLMPETLVSANPKRILEFQKKLNTKLILKPLDERGGRGITLLDTHLAPSKKTQIIRRLKQNMNIPVMAQRFISKKDLKADKRIFILDGKVLASYERRFAKGDFRGNLSQGATHHATTLNRKERKTISEVIPWLKKKNLHFVGLDLLDGKLLEVNVTCPGGVPEADQLYPSLKIFDRYCESVEKRTVCRKNQ